MGKVIVSRVEASPFDVGAGLTDEWPFFITAASNPLIQARDDEL